MKLQIEDRKNALTYAFWSTVNKLLLARQFGKIEIRGKENIPKSGGFMLVANHTSRWDGLLVYNMINRPANFLVHPNELRGFQGSVLKSMGAFPASTQFNLQAHIESQILKGEPVVIFPEGDVYRDPVTHPFKSGVARFALNAVQHGVDVPIIPVAIRYTDDKRNICIQIGQAVQVESTQAVRALTDRLFREVCHMRITLGAELERANLFAPKPNRNWAQPA